MALEPRPTSTVNWAQGPAEFLTTDPGYAKKVVGWDESEIPVSEHHNWLIRELAKWTRYLTGYIENRFYEVHAALTAGIAYPATFRLYAPSSQRWSGGIGTAEQFALKAHDISQILSDGCNVYGRLSDLGVGTWIVAVHPEDPATALWTKAGGADIRLIACDGRFVYMHDTAMTGGVLMLDPDTGAEIKTHNPLTPVITTPIAICANGWMFAVIEDSLPAVIEVFAMDSAAVPTITHAGTVTLTGTSTIRMAMHGNVLYVAYIDSVADCRVAAYAMDTACSLLWSRNINTDFVGNPVPAGIACDGHRIYLATDAAESKAGIVGSVHALSPATGVWLWTFIHAQDCNSIALSAGRVYAGLIGANKFVYTIDAANGAVIRFLSGPDTWPLIAADELCYYMVWATSLDKFVRIWRGGPIVEMQVTNPQDPWREPNPHRAVPVR